MNALIEGARTFGLELSEPQVRAFGLLQTELLVWNEKFNLTGITDPADIRSRHFLDSLSLFAIQRDLKGALSSQPSAISVMDVGAGAGFPAIPLKIACPAWHVTLLEATRKKCDFLEHIIATLQLTDTRVGWARAETAGHAPGEREHFDLVVARAVAELSVLAEYLLPFARVGGQVVAWKGDNIDDEVKAAKGAIGKLGGRLRAVRPVQVPGIELQRHLVVIDKVAPTVAAYPRREGVPAKKPLT
jgi:16S rRNA (guanine527-N7)-methyltransferase